MDMVVMISPKRELDSSGKVASGKCSNATRWMMPVPVKQKSSTDFDVQSSSPNMRELLDCNNFLLNDTKLSCSPSNPGKRKRSESRSPLQDRSLNARSLLPVLSVGDDAASLPNCKITTKLGEYSKCIIRQKCAGGSTPRSRFANQNCDEEWLPSMKAVERPRRLAISPLLKRKRPPSLEIPVTERSCTDFESSADPSPAIIKTWGSSYYGIASKRGDRKDQLEDTYTILEDLMGDSELAFFGVFDGHGGCHAAKFAAKNLAQNVKHAVNASNNKESKIETAVRAGYLSTDEDFLAKRICSGASCVTALIGNSSLVVANAGDCRAVVSEHGTAVALTEDHRVSREDERIRIESLGGYVDCFSGVWRLQGSLAVSRGIGDLHMKQWVSPEPEIRKIKITSTTEFLILASDGLWEKVTNEEAVDIARAELNQTLASEQSNIIGTSAAAEGRTRWGLGGSAAAPKARLNGEEEGGGDVVKACRKLVEVAAGRCCDDITVMLIDLQHFLAQQP